MSRRFYEKDGNLEYLNGRTVAIIGYGSQGHAHALNLRDSGVDVVVSEAPGSPSWAKAEAAGLKVMTTAEAAKVANVIMILVPDHVQAVVYNTDIAPHMTAGQDPHVRARLQYPLQTDRAAAGRGRVHDRAQGSGPSRARAVHRGRGRAGAGGRGAERHRAGAGARAGLRAGARLPARPA